MMPLSENRFGRYSPAISYTGLTSCITVTMFTPPDVFVGAHFVVTGAAEIPGILRGMRALQTNVPGAATELYIAGPTTMWNNSNLPATSPYLANAMFGTFPRELNFGGTILTLETPGSGECLRFSAAGGNVTVHQDNVDVTDDCMPL